MFLGRHIATHFFLKYLFSAVFTGRKSEISDIQNYLLSQIQLELNEKKCISN